MSRLYLRLPFTQHPEAKALGARYDGREKKWYVPDHLDPRIFSKWLPRQLTGLGPESPVVALIIDGNHLIQANRLKYHKGSDAFITQLNFSIGAVINTLHAYGVRVGCVRFHHAAPLSAAHLKRMERDAEICGLDIAAALTRHHVAYHVVEQMHGYKCMGPIPFELMIGETQYNGLRIGSREIAKFEESRLSGNQLREKLILALTPEIKQKTVDTRLNLDIRYFSELNDPRAPNGIALVATDRDFAPALEYALQGLPQLRQAYQAGRAGIYWVGVGNSHHEKCPYEVISELSRFHVLPTVPSA